MQCHASRSDLLAILDALSPLAGGRANALTGIVKLTVTGATLQAQANNSEVEGVRRMAVDEAQDGAAVVTLKSLAEVVKRLDGDMVSLTVAGTMLRIKGGGATMRLPMSGDPASYISILPDLGTPTEVPIAHFLRGFRAVRYAAERSSKQFADPIHTGVHIIPDGDSVIFAAATPARLAVHRVEMAIPQQAVFPLTAASAIDLLDGGETMQVSVNRAWRFSAPHADLAVTPLEAGAAPPKWGAILDFTPERWCRVEARPLLRALERALLVEATKGVDWIVRNDHIAVSAESAEGTMNDQVLLAETQVGAPAVGVRFNPSLMVEAIRQCGADVLSIGVTPGTGNPVIVAQDSDVQERHCIAPYRDAPTVE